MIVDRSRGLQGLHCLFAIAVAWLLFWGLILVVFLPSIVDLWLYFLYSIFIAAGLLIATLRANLKNISLLSLGNFGRAKLAARQTVIVFMTLAVCLLLLKDRAISRVFLGVYMPSLYCCLTALNLFLPQLLARLIFRGRHLRPTILLGPIGRIRKLGVWLERRKLMGLVPLGAITVGEELGDLGSLPVLGRVPDLGRILQQTGATQLIVTDIPDHPQRFRDMATICERFGTKLLVIEDLEDRLGQKVRVVDEDGFHVISTCKEPLESPLNRLTKRTLDLAISIPVVLFILPVISLIVWLAQCFQSPGPLLFKQRRTGAGGKEFNIYKFRTMTPDHAEEERQASPDDPRVFPLGRLLRKLSVDELPQFLNVVTGEMSVVGPRPHLRAHDELFSQSMHSYRMRSFIRPGITGLAQVRDYRGEMKSEKDVINRVECDLYYIENWSLFMDTWIVAKTVLKFIAPPKTSY